MAQNDPQPLAEHCNDTLKRFRVGGVARINLTRYRPIGVCEVRTADCSTRKCYQYRAPTRDRKRPPKWY